MTRPRSFAMVRRLLSRIQFRTASLLIVIAGLALLMAIFRDYFSPVAIWQRGIHQASLDVRISAWGEARRGRIEGLDRHRTIDEVGRALEDADSQTSIQAVQVYPLIQGEPSEVARRLSLRLLDSDTGVRRAAANSIRYAVRAEGEASAIAFSALIEALDDRDAEVRRLAARSLGEISFQVGHSDSFDPRAALRRKLTDPDERVKVAAALAMTHDGAGEEVVPLLLKSLEAHREYDQDCPNKGRSAAFEALMTLGPRSDLATSGLIGRVYREGSGLSSETLTTLAAMINKDYQARERLVARSIDALASNSADLRFSASLVLQRIGEGKQAIPVLVEAFDRGTVTAKPYAANALVLLADSQKAEIQRVADDPKISRETCNFLLSLLPDDPNP